MAHIVEDTLKLAPSAIVVMYELDLTTLGDSIYYFYAGTNEYNGPLVWQGNTYAALPIEAEGFDVSSEGVLPSPKITISNLLGSIGALCRDFNDLLSAKVTRRRTQAKFLDAANFTEGNADADPTVEYEDDVYYVNRKAAETNISIEFELSSPWDVEGILLPKRQIIKNLCYWRYREVGTCGYSGAAVGTEFDVPTGDLAEDECSRTLTGCKLRFGNNPKPYGGFPAAGFVR